MGKVCVPEGSGRGWNHDQYILYETIIFNKNEYFYDCNSAIIVL